MKALLTEPSGRLLAGSLFLITLSVAVPAEDALAETAARRNPPEVAVGGQTVAEQVAQQQALQAALTAEMPAGVAEAVLRIDITQQDRDDLSAPPPNGFEPLRVGVVKSVPGAMGKPAGHAFNVGLTQAGADGTFVWAVNVSSPEAQAIRVHFTEFSLPDNTEMFFFNADGQAHGPYVGAGRNGNGDFWTRSILGDSGVIQLRYSGSTADVDRPNMSFVIAEVGHIRGRLPEVQRQSHDNWPCSDNAPCLVDVNCVNAGPATAAEDAIAKMEWIQGPFINTCTGGLIADSDSGSQIPYFLTANHCLTSSNSNLETFFNYTTDSCNGGCPDSLVTGGDPPPASTIGYTVLRTSSSSDYTLGTLNEAPPAGAVYLGWSTAPVANTNGAHLYRISNANFGPQVYSQHDVDTGSPTCSGIPRGAWIYSQDMTGATMGGSSGSPVVNSAGEIVGQLTGCCGFNCGNECDSENNWTIDGAFAAYYDDVSDLLDPGSGGCTGDPECDDGLFCTGTETCVSGSCQSSGDPCTGGSVCNESTDSCETPACDNDGTCEAGEDCNNCPDDCRSKQNGNPSTRYCCDGDLPDCGDARCSENGWSCGGGGGGCTSDPECDDGLFCNGAETCTGGTCQSGSDPCPGQGCDEGSDQCVTCGGNQASCQDDGDCCSNNCRNGTCRGN